MKNNTHRNLFVLIILHVVIHSSNGASLNASGNGRIIGGDPVGRGDAPFHVGLTLSTNYPFDYFCGGVLIASQYVLTAAHCVDGRPSVTVVAGDHDRTIPETGEQIQTATEFYINERWAASGKTSGDIAIIKLPATFNLNGPFVGSIPMLDSYWLVPPSTPAIVTGWGYSSDSPIQLPNILQKLTVLSMAWSPCRQIAGNDVVCTVQDPESMVDRVPCFGDSGGPLVIRYNGAPALVGVYGGNNAPAGLCTGDGVVYRYTEPFYYKPWICTILGIVC